VTTTKEEKGGSKDTVASEVSLNTWGGRGNWLSEITTKRRITARGPSATELPQSMGIDQKTSFLGESRLFERDKKRWAMGRLELITGQKGRFTGTTRPLR